MGVGDWLHLFPRVLGQGLPGPLGLQSVSRGFFFFFIFLLAALDEGATLSQAWYVQGHSKS